MAKQSLWLAGLLSLAMQNGVAGQTAFDNPPRWDIEILQSVNEPDLFYQRVTEGHGDGGSR